MSLVFVFFTMLIASILLLPSYIISDYREGITRVQADIVRKSIEAREKGASNTIINDTKIKLELLAVKEGNTFLAYAFEKIVDQKTKGVSIGGLFYEKKPDGDEEIRITGKAVSRETLLQFRRNLEKEKIFPSVILPVSNLASDTDIDFSIKITGEF